MESKVQAQALQSLPEELEDYVISHFAPDCEQVSPTAQLIHELVFVWGDDGLEVSPRDYEEYFIVEGGLRGRGGFTTSRLRFPDL